MDRIIRLLFAVFLLATPVQAEEWRSYNYFSLTGGLNDGYDSTAIEDTEASDLQNVVFTTGGAISKRSGFSNLQSSAIASTAAFTALTSWKLSSGTRYLVSLVSDGGTDRIYRMDYGAGTSGPDGTWDNISGGLTLSWGTDDLGDFAPALDVLVVEDGVATTAPYQWTGSGDATALTGAANASMVEYHKNHLFTSGNSAQPSQINFSALCTTASSCLTSWTATDVIHVETNDGQTVQGLKSGLDALYVWKDRSIWRISGTDRDTFILEQMVRGIGTCSNNSIAVINNKFIFLSCEGDVIIYDGGINVQIISAKIEGTLTAINLDRVDEAIAIAFDDGTGGEDYYLSLSASASSTHDRLLVFDTFHQAWTKFLGINANAMATYEIGTLQTALVFGNYIGDANRYPNTNADDGAAINAFYQSGQLQFDLPQEKIFRLAQIFVNQEGAYNLTFEYRLDFEAVGTSSSISLAGSGSLWDTAIFGTDAFADITTVTGRVEGFRICDFFQWRVSNTNAAQPFLVKGIRIFMEPTGRVGGIARAGWDWLTRWLMPSAWAGELPSPPPLGDEPVAEQQYLQRIYQEHNNLVRVTTNPDGNRRGQRNDLILYSNAGSLKFCVNDSTTPNGGTVWRCNANALTAP